MKTIFNTWLVTVLSASCIVSSVVLTFWDLL